MDVNPRHEARWATSDKHITKQQLQKLILWSKSSQIWFARQAPSWWTRNTEPGITSSGPCPDLFPMDTGCNFPLKSSLWASHHCSACWSNDHWTYQWVKNSCLPHWPEVGHGISASNNTLGDMPSNSTSSIMKLETETQQQALLLCSWVTFSHGAKHVTQGKSCIPEHKNWGLCHYEIQTSELLQLLCLKLAASPKKEERV